MGEEGSLYPFSRWGKWAVGGSLTCSWLVSREQQRHNRMTVAETLSSSIPLFWQECRWRSRWTIRRWENNYAKHNECNDKTYNLLRSDIYQSFQRWVRELDLAYPAPPAKSPTSCVSVTHLVAASFLRWLRPDTKTSKRFAGTVFSSPWLDACSFA